MGLTEWALLEVHLNQCARCRQGEAHLRQLGVMIVPRRALLMERIRASLAGVRTRAAHAMPSALSALRRTIRFVPSVHAVGAVLTLLFILCALRSEGPQALASLPAPPPPALEPVRVEPTQVEPARLEPTRLEPAQNEPVQAEPVRARPVQLVPSVPTASAVKKTVSEAPPRIDERRSASPESVREVGSSPPALLSEPPLSAAHVVGRLSAKNPRTAWRDFIALLADVGGSELGRSQRVKVTAIEVVVPQSRYDEFSDGLARIGSWRLDAARFPLPEAVHMTIRMSE